jgi:hypothetical protein
LKNNNKTYCDSLRTLLINGFREYYDDLNKKALEEQQKQEGQQKTVHTKVDNYDDKISDLTKKVYISNNIRKIKTILPLIGS